MWKALNSIIYGEQKQIQTGLICLLFLNKDKTKSINIQVYEKTTIKELYEKFKEVIEGNIAIIDKETQEYKFILKDKTNNYNEFILKNNFLVFDYLLNEKYELFYLPCNKKKSYSISMALKEKNSFQHIENKQDIQIKPFKEQLLKEDTAYKFSKKLNQFVKIKIILHSDILEINKIKSKKEPTIIPLSSISDIKVVYDKTFKQGYTTMMISSVYSSKTKEYYISFNSDLFDNWFTVINNHMHQFLDPFTFKKICQDLNDLNRKKTSLLIQLVNKCTYIKGVLSLNFSKKIFYEFYDNNIIKEIYDLIQIYKENIKTKKYLDANVNINKIINLLEENKDIIIEYEENKNVLDILKQFSEKIKEKIEKDKNNINDNEKKINEIEKDNIKNDNGLFFNINDNLIRKYFEPRFNEIMNTKLKIDFLNKIMDYILKYNIKEDNDFCDINSTINELIIVNE